MALFARADDARENCGDSLGPKFIENFVRTYIFAQSFVGYSKPECDASRRNNNNDAPWL